MLARRAIAIALLAGTALSAGTAFAQSVTADERQSIVWRLSRDGDWIAAVRDDGSAGPELVLAPIQPQLGVALAPQGSGLVGVLAIDSGQGVRASLSGERHPLGTAYRAATAAVPPPWCSSLAGLLSAAELGNECFGTSGSEREPVLRREQVALSWQGGPFGVALAVGQSRSDAPVAAWDIASDAALVPWTPLSRGGPIASASMLPGFAGRGRDVALGTSWRISPSTALNLSAALGAYSLRPDVLSAPLAVDQLALQLGLSYGRFSGGLTGRVVRPAGATDGSSDFTGLDLGISWRMPWSGELSFGARNLISRGSEGLSPNPESALDEATARTPYVRYKQDL